MVSQSSLKLNSYQSSDNIYVISYLYHLPCGTDHTTSSVEAQVCCPLQMATLLRWQTSAGVPAIPPHPCLYVIWT